MRHVPRSWLDTTRPPLGWSRDDWQRMSWAARDAATRAMRPPPPADTDPAWRRAAIDARALLDAAAPDGVGHVRHPRPVDCPQPAKSSPTDDDEPARSVA